jgi:hypothetical protein
MSAISAGGTGPKSLARSPVQSVSYIALSTSECWLDESHRVKKDESTNRLREASQKQTFRAYLTWCG